MLEEQIAALQQHLELLQAQNDEYKTALSALRPIVSKCLPPRERRKLLQAVTQSKSPLQVQIWRFVLGEVESLHQGHLDLRK
ncbi:hypothetical protein MHM88_22375 [Epibacterium sp. MM17-32]|uniref:hypothetical protein n=1 Tax=Epibacterium sp. MM17-32 TaxID=2917734 RepID=UPI001EF605A0|nr:hypothetical protein [Epibacterium sp. MM17-32]MCG7630557.1 hypothetical protein [Epibacterium sp. MM17-32]